MPAPFAPSTDQRLALLDAHAHAGKRGALAIAPLQPVEIGSPACGREASLSTVSRLVGINHVALEVGDLDAALEFYGRAFEFELRGRVPGMAFLDMGDQFLAIAATGKAAADGERALRAGGGRPRGRRVGACGKRAPTSQPGRGLDFRDPWGNHVQVVEYAQVQFSKTAAVLDGMGLAGLEKTPEALEELRRKGLGG